MKTIIISLLYELFMFVFSLLLGLAAMPNPLKGSDQDKNNIVSFFCAPLIGFSIFAAFSFLLGNIFPYNSVLIITLFTASLVFILFRKKQLFIIKDKAAWSFIIISFVLSILIILCCIPTEIDGGVYFKASSFDHQRTAIIDAIALAGFPLRSSWIADNGNLITDVNHCGLQTVMAQPVILFGMWALEAGAGISGLIFLLMMLLVGALVYHMSGKKLSWIFVILVFFIGSPGDTLVKYVSPYWQEHFSLREYYNGAGYEGLFGFWPLNNDIVWSPHSIFSGCVTLFLVYLFCISLRESDRKSAIHTALIMGMMAGAAFVSNVYAGVIALFIFMLSLLPIYIFSRSFRNDFNKTIPYQAFMGVIGLAVASPFLYSLFSMQDTTNVGTIYGVLPPFDSAKGLFQIIKVFFEFTLVTLTARYGIFQILGIAAMVVPNILPKERFTKIASVYFLIVSVIIFFCRSSFYSNDLGWRMPNATKIFCFCCCAVLLERCCQWLYTKKAFFAYTLIAAVILMAVIFSDNVVYNFTPIKNADAETHIAFAKAAAGWKVVRQYTGKTDLVLCNPSAFSEMTYNSVAELNNSYLFSYYAGRFSAMADIVMAENIITDEEMPKYKKLYQFVIDFFNGAPTKEDVQYIAEEMKVKALLITPDDAIWENNDVLSNLYENKAETDGYKVFILK